jgi:hypothetical protein
MIAAQGTALGCLPTVNSAENGGAPKSAPPYLTASKSAPQFRDLLPCPHRLEHFVGESRLGRWR